MLLLHVWPGRWDLPSIDIECLAAILYLQLIAPGKFTLVECSNPDLSPTGQLPLLVNNEDTISTFSSIVAYMASLDRNFNPTSSAPSVPLDANLTSQDAAKAVAWRSYVDTQLGDLVLNSFYSLAPNYFKLTAPTLVSMLPFPQKYWVPGRIRDMYKPRLEASGLWEVLDEKDKKDEIQVNSWTLKSKANETFGHAETLRRTFGKEKILEKGKAVFDLLTSLLKQSSFIFNERPSILDVRLAAHILLLLHAPLPNPLLKTLLLDSYTPLVDHALLVRTYAFPSSDPSRAAPPVEPLEHSSVTQNLWLVGGAAQRVFHTTFGSDVASA